MLKQVCSKIDRQEIAYYAWLGFLPSFLLSGVLGSLFLLALNLIFDVPLEWSEISLMTFQSGVLSAFFGIIAGLSLCRFKKNSTRRWVWLTFIIPILSAALQIFFSTLQDGSWSSLQHGDNELVVAVCFAASVITVIARIHLIHPGSSRAVAP